MRWPGWFLLVVWSHHSASAGLRPDTTDSAICEQAALGAEQEFSLPSGILSAIGKVESGAWPWAANIDGAAELYQSKAEAVEALSRVRSPRPVNMDLGCFQISTRFHPAAFASVAEALDPVANASYAARFLRTLRDKTGDWSRAVGAYHSATEPLEAAYRQRVMALWKPAPADVGIDAIAAAIPRWRVISIGDQTQPDVRVWSLASLPDTVGGMKLPRVVTSGR